MKKEAALTILVLCLVLYSCVMCGPFPKDYPVDIKAEKTFYLPLSKNEIFKIHLTEAHPYSESIAETLTDSLYYIYCPAKEKESNAIFECKIKSITNDSTLIQTYRIAWLSIIESEEVGQYYTNLSGEEYLKFFEDNFISHLKKGDKHMQFYQDNKRTHDILQTGNNHLLDSLDKVHKE